MEETVNTTAAEETQDGFPAESGDADDWDDVDLSDLRDDAAGEEEPAPEEEHKEEKPSQEEQETPEEESREANQEKEEPKDEPQTFRLEHQGRVTEVDRDQVIQLAQKGMAYDAVSGELEAARQETARLAELETFLKELAQPQGLSVEDLMDNTRAQLLAEKEHLDPGVALQRVKLDKERRAFEADRDQKQKAQQAQDQETVRRQGSFLRFHQEYPDVDPKSIPKEVWDQFGAGTDLADAYARFEAKSLRAQLQEANEKLAAAETNAKNKERSTGSQQSAGAEAPMDAIDRDWYDGT